MKLTPFHRVLTRTAFLFVAAGCVHFRPSPLSAARSLDAFEARTLDRPDLGNYLKTNSLAASWPLTRWDLPSLTLAAFFYHPDLDVARAQFDVSKGENRRAGERANPSLTLAPGYNSSRPAGAVSYWIADVALTLPVETAGKRGYRIDQARQLSEAARLMIAQTAWQIRREVRASLLELYSALENEAQARRLQALQAEAVSLLLAQADAGEVPRMEVSRARMQEQASELTVLSARQRQAAAQVRLAGAVGVPVKAFDKAEFAFDAVRRLPPIPPATDLQRAALLNRTDLLSALAEYEASQAALHLEIAKQVPDVELGPAYQYDQGENKWALGFTATLPVFNRNQGAIAAAEARRAESAAKFKALQARAISEIEQAGTAYRSALEKTDAAQRLSSGLEQKAKTVLALRAAGEVSRLDVVTERIERATVEQTCLEARLEALQALGNIEDVLQMPSDLSSWTERIPSVNTASSEDKNHE